MKLVLATLTAALVASGITFAAAAAGPAGPVLAEADGASPSTPTPTPIKPQCFYTRDMGNHTVGGPNDLYIDVRGRGVYRVTMSNACLAGASSSDPLILKNRTGSTNICRPLDLDISIGRTGAGGFATPCIVSSIALLAPKEVEALPKRIRP